MIFGQTASSNWHLNFTFLAKFTFSGAVDFFWHLLFQFLQCIFYFLFFIFYFLFLFFIILFLALLLHQSSLLQFFSIHHIITFAFHKLSVLHKQTEHV